MHIDLPYFKYRALVHDGLAAIPVARRVQPHDVEIGVVADGSRMTFFSKAVGGRPFAARIMKADGDAIVKEPGAFSIETQPLSIPVKTINRRTYRFSRPGAEQMLCPRLVDGFDKTNMRVRLFTSGAHPSSGSGGQDDLRFELYRPEMPSRGPLISGGFAGAPLADFKTLDSAECVLSIKASVLRRYARNFAGLLKMRGALLEINMVHNSCALTIHNPGLSSKAELLPGECETRQGAVRVSLGGIDFLSAAGKSIETDFRIYRLADVAGRNGGVRLSVSDRHYDCECDWDQNPKMMPESYSAAPCIRPIVVAREEIRQAAVMVRSSVSDKIRLRLHHEVALLTLLRGTRKPPCKDSGGVVVVACYLPPSQKGVSSWCISLKHLLQVIRSMTGTKIRMYPADAALILVDPDEPFVRHRLACLVPDDLGAEVENELMAIEASMVAPPGP